MGIDFSVPKSRAQTRANFSPSSKTTHFRISTMRPALSLLARSSWKGPHVVPLPIANAIKTGTPIRTNSRSCTILPQFVGLKFQIHNGKEYVEVEITDEMVGSKLGEFAATRKRFMYKFSKN